MTQPNEPESMHREFDELRRIRDELRLQAHLGGMEARDLWADLEERFEALETNMKRLTRGSEEAIVEVGDAVTGALGELREGYDRLRSNLADPGSPERLWDRIRGTFDRLVGGGQRATERIVDSFEDLSGAARVRVEKARLERQVLKKFAKLGTRVFELASEAGFPTGTSNLVLDDEEVEDLMAEIRSIDVELRKIRGEVSDSES